MRWDWDAASGTYLRSEGGRAHTLADGSQVSTNNVVVLVNEYRPTSFNAISPEAVSVGSGLAFVFTGGKIQAGTWTRADRTSPIDLTHARGRRHRADAGADVGRDGRRRRPRHHLRLTALGEPSECPSERLVARCWQHLLSRWAAR